MTFEQLQRYLTRVTYKQCTKIDAWAQFSIENPRPAPFVLRVAAMRPDEGNQSQTIQVEIRDDFDERTLAELSEGDVLERVRLLIEKLEAHEQREFFKLDGKHVVEPHPGQRLTLNTNNSKP